MIQNQLDGKLIEFGDPSDSNTTPLQSREEDLSQTVTHTPTGGGSQINTSSNLMQHGSAGNQYTSKTLDGDDQFTIDSVHRYNKKLESLNYEYNRMLASTLDNQRAYYEQRL